jgi:hypothetical protein
MIGRSGRRVGWRPERSPLGAAVVSCELSADQVAGRSWSEGPIQKMMRAQSRHIRISAIAPTTIPMP